jgi:hypothetical protein
MVSAHWDGVEAYCHEENKVPLGFVEGLNNKIRVIQRRAYGFRDEEHLRLKILTCMQPKHRKLPTRLHEDPFFRRSAETSRVKGTRALSRVAIGAT